MRLGALKQCKRRESEVGGAVQQGAVVVDSGVLMSLLPVASKRYNV